MKRCYFAKRLLNKIALESKNRLIHTRLEYAQLLCSAVWATGAEAPYRPTHLNHPCALWVRTSLSNWLWLKDLAQALNEEYRYRYAHTTDHRSWIVIQALTIPALQDLGITEHPQVMPEHYRIFGDPITAYRHFYLGEKQALLQWRKRPTPEWVISKNHDQY